MSFPIIDSNDIIFSGLIGARLGCVDISGELKCSVSDCNGKTTCKVGLD